MHIDLFVKSAKKYYGEIQKDSNGRYRSWEYCYTHFYTARGNDTDIDYLSLHLAFYLASWGMYRGSSFLLQKDYKVHIPVVKEILDSKYDSLFGIDCAAFHEEDCVELLRGLNVYISEYYDGIRRSVKGQELKYQLSTTLVTKVLIGTMGCVPAYDRYFIAGIKSEKVATGSYNINSIRQLADFYLRNFDCMEECRREMQFGDGLLYPPMKLLDMGFWQIGYEKS